MFKLIFFLIGLAIAIVFSALNIGNTTDISFGFRVLEDIPVFLSIFSAFLAGAVFTMPFAFHVSRGNKKASKNKKAASFVDDKLPDQFQPQNDIPEVPDVE